MTMFKLLHKYYDDCFTEGKFDSEKVLAKKLIDTDYLTEYRLNILENIYKAVLSAKFHNELSLYYLMNSNKTFDDCVVEFNNLNNADLNIATGRSRIIYCSRKVNEIFEEVDTKGKKICALEWLLDKNYHRGENEVKLKLRQTFLEQLSKFNDIHGEKIAIGKKDLVISLPSCEKVTKLSSERFNEFMDIVRPYSREYIKHVQDEVNTMVDEVGYIKFLLSPKSELTEEDRERKNVILRWLGRPELIDIGSDNAEDASDENIEDIEVFF